MDATQHQQREQSLSSALQRLSAAREARGPVGTHDPFEIVSEEARRAVAEPPRAMRRRGLFSFASRARDAAQ